MVPTEKTTSPLVHLDESVEMCFWPFSFQDYEKAESRIKQKSLVLSAFHSALIFVAKERGWKLEPFVDAEALIISRNYQFKGELFKKWIKHPLKDVSANVIYEYLDDRINLDVAVRRNQDRQTVYMHARRKPIAEDQLRRLAKSLHWKPSAKKSVLVIGASPISWGDEDTKVDVTQLVEALQSRS